jgi:hypothetical protein
MEVRALVQVLVEILNAQDAQPEAVRVA